MLDSSFKLVYGIINAVLGEKFFWFYKYISENMLSPLYLSLFWLVFYWAVCILSNLRPMLMVRFPK